MKVNKKWGDKIYVEWTDACSDSEWKNFEQSMDIPNEVFCRTYGFYLGQKEGFIIVAHTIGKGPGNDIAGRLLIPIKWVRKAK